MNRRTKVLSAVVLVAAAGFVLDRLLLTPWTQRWARLSEEISAAEVALDRARAVASRAADVRQRWEKVTTLLAHPRVPDVQTHFVSHIDDLADRVGGTFEIQGSREQQQGDFREYVYEAKFKLTYRQLGDLLVALHNSGEFLKPLRLGISSQYEREDRLDLDLKVSTIEYAPMAKAVPK